MKLIARNMLFIICMITAFQISANAQEILVKNPERLDPQFVEIEISDINAVSVSVLKSIQNIAQFIQAKSYSLLNWRSRSRSVGLDVDNYDRVGQFGRWINDPAKEDCLNTRARVLVRDSAKNVVYKENSKCVVQQGTWNDPYTSSVFENASEIQIDHLVPLKNAYLSGAHKWDFKSRCLYANYMGYDFHLLSVNGTENMRKSDKGPDAYMPPNSGYACTYVRNWVAVKMLWGLTMTVSEANAVRQTIIDNGCSTATFRISEGELNRQRKFAQDNIEICQKWDKPADVAQAL